MAKILFNNKTGKDKNSVNQSKSKTVEKDTHKDEKVLKKSTKLSFVDKTTKTKPSFVDKSSKSKTTSVNTTSNTKPKVEEKVIEQPKVTEKIKLSFVDKSEKSKPVAAKPIAKPIAAKPIAKPVATKPIAIKEKPKPVIQPKPVIPRFKIKKCPFTEGDLIKYKNEIYLVNKDQFGDFYIHTETILKMKQFKPEDWGVFNKIS